MVKVKIVNKNNTVKVKIKLEGSSCIYYKGEKRNIRMNMDEDRKEYTYIVPYHYFYRFLDANGISEKDIEVDKESIDTFYGYDQWGNFDFFVKPTKAKVANWWNYDCPMLSRYEVNKDESVTILGMKIVCFSSILCEASWNYTSIGEDITEEEVALFVGDRTHTHIYNEMKKALEARELKTDDIEQMKKDIAAYDEKVQRVIDENKEIILEKIEPYKEQNFGLDCGWVNLYTENEEYREKRKLLKNTKGEYCLEYMSVKLPYRCQSTTVQRMQFDAIKDILKKEIGDTIYASTQLD